MHMYLHACNGYSKSMADVRKRIRRIWLQGWYSQQHEVVRWGKLRISTDSCARNRGEQKINQEWWGSKQDVGWCSAMSRLTSDLVLPPQCTRKCLGRSLHRTGGVAIWWSSCTTPSADSFPALPLAAAAVDAFVEVCGLQDVLGLLHSDNSLCPPFP